MTAQAGTADAAAVERGPVWLAVVLLLSLMVPFIVTVGGVFFTAHRLFLIVVFVPLFLRLFVHRKAGPILAIDWLLLASTAWASLSFLVNHPFGQIIEAVGLHALEFFGSYLVARVAIRSGEDFRRVVRIFFVIVLGLLPLALVESITHRPFALDLIPGKTVVPVYSEPRMGLRRAQTIFAHPILYGIFASTGLGLFWYMMRPKWLAFGSVPMVFLSTFLSLSTGAILSFMVQALTIGWETVLKVIRMRWKIFAALAIAGYITIDLLSDRTPFHVVVTYLTFSSGSGYYRINIWTYGIQNVWANPIFGLGFRDWERASWMWGASVDNFWLLLTMRHGFPAIIPFLVAIYLIFRRVSFADLPNDVDARARAAYLTAIGGLIFAGATVHYWHAMLTFVMFIFGTGIWSISGGGAREATDAPAAPATRDTRLRFTRQTARHVRPASGQAARVQAAARADRTSR